MISPRAALRSRTGDDGEFLRDVIVIPLVRTSLRSHSSRTFQAGNNYMSGEEIAVFSTQQDEQTDESVWVETGWGVAAVVIAAGLVALGGFYYFVACMTTK